MPEKYSNWNSMYGRSRGGFTSKVHCIADALGRPIAFHLTPGQATDITAYEHLIDFPEKMPKAFLADKAYDADRIRNDLRERGINSVIPPRSNRKDTIPFDDELYRHRNCVAAVDTTAAA